MALGSAIARGILQGIGDAGGKIADDKRQAKRAKAESESQFKAFKDKTDYSVAKQAAVVENNRAHQAEVTASDRAFQVEQATLNRKADQSNRIQLSNARASNAIRTSRVQTMLSAASKRFDNTVLGDSEYRRLAGMTNKELAAMKADAFAKPFGKDLYGRMFNESLKDSNERTHAQLIKDNGGVMADYSQFVGTEFESGIPPKTGPGGIDMGSTFTYDPKTQVSFLEEQVSKLSFNQQEVIATQGVIESTLVGLEQKPVSQSLVETIRINTKGKQPDYIDAEGNRRNVYLDSFNAQVASGQVTEYKGQLMKASEAFIFEEQDRIAEEMTLEKEAATSLNETLGDTKAALEVPKATQELGIDPAEASVITRERQEKQDAQTTAGIKTINKDNDLENASAVEEILTDLEGLGDEQFDIEGVGISGLDVRRGEAAIRGDETALAAKKMLSKVAFVRNKIRNKLFGATLTDNEQASFNEAWDELGKMTTKQGYTQQIKVVQGLIDKKLTSVLAESDEDTQRDMARRHPSILRVMAANIMRENNLDPKHRAEVERRITAQE